tara:strand:+ start:424 stop:834 length:411 start_codon:yes stop_codon:yes gene_type:complete
MSISMKNQSAYKKATTQSAFGSKGKFLGKLGAIAGGFLGSMGGPAGTFIGSSIGGALGLMDEEGTDQYLKRLTDQEHWMPLASESMAGSAFNWKNPAVNPVLKQMGFQGEAAKALESQYNTQQKKKALMSMLGAGI